VTPVDQRATALRLATFAALAAFAAFHWFTLVADPPLGRAALLVLVATAGGALLAGLGSAMARSPGRVGTAAAGALAALVTFITLFAALAATGVPADLLPPWRWDDLANEIDPALRRFHEIPLPYDGGGRWMRLAILLAAPIALATAAALAFWPAGRRAPILRGLSLAALLALYGVAVSWDGRRAELALGLVLLVLTAAWLWGPRIAARRGRWAAVATLAVAAVAALPVAARLDPAEPLLDYKQWTPFGEAAPAGFDWTHSYGPLDWPRQGTVLAEVKADEARYWKAEVLDEFDGLRWRRPPFEAGTPSLSPFSLTLQESSASHQEWTEVAGFELRGMRSHFVLGPGTIESVAGLEGVTPEGDGTTTVGGDQLRPGDRWAVISYVPDPTPGAMAAAGGYGPEVMPYTKLTVPIASGGLDPFGDSDQGLRQSVSVRPWGSASGGTPGAEEIIATGPYGEVYRLARRLTAEAPNPYAAALAIQSYLGNGFDYSEDVPLRPYPIPAFLFEDKAGYCQQFSGAMALLLRMSGIPARVAAGFAPGAFDSGGGRFEVTDFDAHSWVEVYFPGIGWVTFDPTPGAAPPRTQPSSGLGPASRTGSGAAQGRPLPEVKGETGLAPARGGGEDGSPVGTVLAGLGATAALAAAAVAAVSVRRRRRLRSGRFARDQIVEVAAALPRLGWRTQPGATLLSLERRLATSAGPAAAAYVAGLRRHLYEAGRRPPPGPGARRAFRRAVTGSRGRRARLRGWLALPPGGPRHRSTAVSG